LSVRDRAGGPISGSTVWDAPTPQEVAAFIADYATQRNVPFSALEQRTALGAAYWRLAYNARCQLSWFGPASTPLVDSILAARLTTETSSSDEGAWGVSSLNDGQEPIFW
jgi:hypothetical protein